MLHHVISASVWCQNVSSVTAFLVCLKIVFTEKDTVKPNGRHLLNAKLANICACRTQMFGSMNNFRYLLIFIVCNVWMRLASVHQKGRFELNEVPYWQPLQHWSYVTDGGQVWTEWGAILATIAALKLRHWWSNTVMWWQAQDEISYSVLDIGAVVDTVDWQALSCSSPVCWGWKP